MLMQGDAMAVDFNSGGAAVRLDMGYRDTLSIPGDTIRAFSNPTDQTLEAVVILPGDQRKHARFDMSLVAAARAADWALDANGYLAPASLLPKSALLAGERHAA